MSSPVIKTLSKKIECIFSFSTAATKKGKQSSSFLKKKLQALDDVLKTPSP